MDALLPLQALTVPGILGTLIVIGIVLIIGKFLLNLAFKIVVFAAIVAGVLWLLGVSSLPSLFLV
jgi:hypothetical protein